MFFLFITYNVYCVLFQLVGGEDGDVGVAGEDRWGDLTPGGGSREGHFSGGEARVVLPVTLSLRGYTSLSFRTCSHGTLLEQVRK